jgi:hypothetical protein
MSYDFNLPVSRMPDSQQPSSGEKETPEKKPRAAQLKKQTATHFLTTEFKKVKVEDKPKKQLKIEKQQTGWKQSKPSSHLIDKLVLWLKDKGAPEQEGVRLITALAELPPNPSQPNKLKDRVVTSIRANFAAEDIGSVLGKLEKIYPIDRGSAPPFVTACCDELSIPADLPRDPSAPPGPGPEFDWAAWNKEGEQAMEEFVTQLIDENPESMRDSYDSLLSVIRKVTDLTEHPDRDEFDSWIDKALKGKSPTDLDKIAIKIEKFRDIEIFRSLKQRFYMRLLNQPFRPVLLIGDLTQASCYISAFLSDDARLTDVTSKLEDRIFKASDENWMRGVLKLEALFACGVALLDPEDLVRLELRLRVGPSSHSHGALDNVLRRDPRYKAGTKT